MKVHRLIFPIFAGLALAIALLFAAVRQSRAALDTNAEPMPSASLPGSRTRRASNPQTVVRYVATSGIDGGDCADSANPCRTVQYAIDQAVEGDEVRVASGIYTDTLIRPRQDITTTGYVTQVVYISKTIAVQGGYTLTNWITPDPDANPTILDAQGEGRVVYITGLISPTLDGFQITGGDSTGLGGIQLPYNIEQDAGGGLYIQGASANISNLQVINNISPGYAAGIHLSYSNTTIEGNTITQNTAISGDGGGLFAYHGVNSIYRNKILNNQAMRGGGFFQEYGESFLAENEIISNTSYWAGGIFYNSANSQAVSNQIRDNVSAQSWGGGLYIDSSNITLQNNTIHGNTAPGYMGGGIYAGGGNLIMEGNTVTGNYAFGTGGILLENLNGEMTNNIIADNDSLYNSAGIMIRNHIGDLSLRHNTIARNTGDAGTGVLIGDGTVTLTDNIIVSHTVGVYYRGNPILEGTLWGSGIWANGTDWQGDGTIITGTVNVWGDPGFLDPDNGDYHIGHGSAAIDAGVDAGVYTDIDGELRPVGLGFDIGADELKAALRLGMGAAPDPVASGDVLTYTLHLTNTGAVELHATITQTLPNGVTPGGILTWTASLPMPGSEWTETVVVTVDPDYSGPLTSTLQASSLEGVQGMLTSTINSIQPISGLVAVNDSPTVLGQPTTFTATVNTGSHLTFSWDFGDGVTASGTLVTHTYSSMGLYTATVTASNAISSQDTQSVVRVEQLVGGLSALSDTPTAWGEETIFTATVSAGSDLLYEWDFGDGATGVGEWIKHTYPTVGIYTATVTASNKVSAQSAQTGVVVEEAISGLNASSGSPTILGQPTAFTATIATGSNIIFTWDFGDGDSGQGPIVVHSYSSPGIFIATLTASNLVSHGSVELPILIIQSGNRIYLPLSMKSK